MSPITILSSTTIDHLLSLPTTLPLALASQKSLFLTFATDPSAIQCPLRISTNSESHQTMYMPSLSPLGSGIKIVSVPLSPVSTDGLPASTLIIDDKTGKLTGLINARKLTALRNACSSALFLQHTPFPRGPPKTLTIFGSGLQALTHAKVFITLFPSIEEITVVARRETERLGGMMKELMELGEGRVKVSWALAGDLEEQEKGDKEVEEHTPQPEVPEEDYLPEDGGVEQAEEPCNPVHLTGINEFLKPSAEIIQPPSNLSESWTSAEDSQPSEGYELVESLQSPIQIAKSVLSSSETPDPAHPVDSVPLAEFVSPTPSAPPPSSLPIPNRLLPLNLPQILHNTHLLLLSTPSRSPLFLANHITSQTHIVLIGSYTQEMQEVQPELVRRAGVVVCDTVEGCVAESGDLGRAGWGKEGCVELGELVGEKRGEVVRRMEESGDVYLYKSVGVGIQDVAIAKLMLEQAQIHGLGSPVDFD